MPIFECSRCNEMTYSSAADAAGACARCGSERHRLLTGSFGEARGSARELGGADHATLVYDDPSQIAPFCCRFLTEGVDAGEHVVAGLQQDVRARVTALLAPDVELAIDWREPSELYGDFDAERVAETYEAMIAGEERPTRLLAGVDRRCVEGVTAEDLDRYEAAAHRIITGHGATVVCLYDMRVLPEEFLAISARRHTLSVQDGAVRRNERFEYEPA
jgi:hypothetical protein